MNNFRKLQVWQDSMDLVTAVYELVKTFPKEEKYGLTSQIRRSAVSVPSNIAEGAGRNTKGEFRQFLGIANASSFELETQLELSVRTKMATESQVLPLINNLHIVQKMLYKLIESLKK